MNGLCHVCLKSNVTIDVIHGKAICKDCQKNNAKK